MGITLNKDETELLKKFIGYVCKYYVNPSWYSISKNNTITVEVSSPITSDMCTLQIYNSCSSLFKKVVSMYYIRTLYQRNVVGTVEEVWSSLASFINEVNRRRNFFILSKIKCLVSNGRVIILEVS